MIIVDAIADHIAPRSRRLSSRAEVQLDHASQLQALETTDGATVAPAANAVAQIVNQKQPPCSCLQETVQAPSRFPAPHEED